VIDSHWAQKHIAQNIFNVSYKGRISIKCSVSYIWILNCWREEKNINPTCPAYEKQLWHCSTDVGASGL